MEKIPTFYNYYNFILKQIDIGSKEAFCILYKGKEIAVYDGKVPIEKIQKNQINYHLDYYFPMDFLRFCNDYFNFRMIISNKRYIYTFETKQEFFFHFPIFDEYCSQIKLLIKTGIIDIDKKLNKAKDLTEVFNDDHDKMHQKVFSLIEMLYNNQRSYTTNPILNNKIHTVTSYYPDFGFLFDILKDKVKLFEENGDFLILNKKKKYTAIELAWFFMKISPTLQEKKIEALFNVKNISQAYENSRYKCKDKINKFNRIFDELKEFIVL